LVLVGHADHSARIEGWEIQDRLPQANEDVLRLAGDQFPADQFPGFFFGLRFA
jgi:hypothetical protein